MLALTMGQSRLISQASSNIKKQRDLNLRAIWGMVEDYWLLRAIKNLALQFSSHVTRKNYSATCASVSLFVNGDGNTVHCIEFFFCCRCCSLTPFIEQTVLSPLYSLGSFDVNSLTAHVWIYFWSLYSVPMFHVSLFTQYHTVWIIVAL